MKEWTPEARQALDAYMAHLQRWAKATGQDGAEIAEGIREHVEADLEQIPENPITEEAVRRSLAILGAPHEIVPTDTGAMAIPAKRGEGRTSADQVQGCVNFLFPMLTLITAAIAIVFELFSRCMASMYLDPMPDLGHLAGLILIVAGLIVGEKFQKMPPDAIGNRFRAWVYILNGFALVLSFLYFVVYIPMLPMAAFCSIFLLGLMGFAPLMCSVLSALHTRHLWRRCGEIGVTRAWVLKKMGLGVLLILVLVGPFHVWNAATDWAIGKALSDNPADKIRGQRWLRGFGNVEPLAFGAPRWSIPFHGPVASQWPDESYQRLYYEITGKDPNLVANTAQTSTTARFLGLTDTDLEDMDMDLEDPAHLGVSLFSSTMDGVVDAATATAYLEWTLEFLNREDWGQSALAHIRLPHGSVASRLTLWVNGEPCEAAYGTRNQAVQAYRDVAVVQRRDPALLTVSGPNSVALECFPVPAHGKLKVKVGFTIPLEVCESGAVLSLPFFEAQDFEISNTLSRSI